MLDGHEPQSGPERGGGRPSYTSFAACVLRGRTYCADVLCPAAISRITLQLAESYLTVSLFRQILQRIRAARVAPDMIASPAE